MLCNDARLYALAGPGEITSLSEKVYESYTGAFIAFDPRRHRGSTRRLFGGWKENHEGSRIPKNPGETESLQAQEE